MAMQGINKKPLKNAIKIIEEWAKNNDMALNKKKCGIIIHKGNLNNTTDDTK